MSQESPKKLPNPSLLTSHVRQVEDLAGPAGRLEALLNTGASDSPLCALITHPYPPAGGTMHTRVVYHTMKTLTSLGIPVLRFNFRGVGLSTGAFDNGRGEQGDVLAALAWLETTFACPILFAGFSFGSYVGLRACCSDSRVIARIALGLPVRAANRDYTYDFLDQCPGPMLFLSGGEDEFCPPSNLTRIVGQRPERQITLIPGADHFFQGTPHSPASKLGEMQQTLRDWLQQSNLPILRRSDLPLPGTETLPTQP